jgi:hypothetical protein
MPDQPTPTAVRAELAVMRRIVAALDSLDDRAQARVMRYLADRYDREPSVVLCGKQGCADLPPHPSHPYADREASL